MSGYCSQVHKYWAGQYEVMRCMDHPLVGPRSVGSSPLARLWSLCCNTKYRVPARDVLDRCDGRHVFPVLTRILRYEWHLPCTRSELLQAIRSSDLVVDIQIPALQPGPLHRRAASALRTALASLITCCAKIGIRTARSVPEYSRLSKQVQSDMCQILSDRHLNAPELI